MMAIVTICGTLLGIVIVPEITTLRRYERSVAIEREVERLGGTATRSGEGRFSVMAWAVGQDYPSYVSWIQLGPDYDSTLPHEPVRKIKGKLSHLNDLLVGTNILSIDLNHTDVVDDDILCYAELPRLERLDLSFTSIEGHAFKKAGWRKLRVVNLGGEVVDDVCLQNLSNVGNIQEVHLRHLVNLNNGLQALGRVSSLKVLEIAFSADSDRVVSGRDIEWLPGSEVVALYIEAKSLAEDAYPYLENAKRLRSLHVPQSFPPGAAELKLRSHRSDITFR
jgi:hypothetical protein